MRRGGGAYFWDFAVVGVECSRVFYFSSHFNLINVDEC